MNSDATCKYSSTTAYQFRNLILVASVVGLGCGGGSTRAAPPIESQEQTLCTGQPLTDWDAGLSPSAPVALVRGFGMPLSSQEMSQLYRDLSERVRAATNRTILPGSGTWELDPDRSCDWPRSPGERIYDRWGPVLVGVVEGLWPEDAVGLSIRFESTDQRPAAIAPLVAWVATPQSFESWREAAQELQPVSPTAFQLAMGRNWELNIGEALQDLGTVKVYASGRVERSLLPDSDLLRPCRASTLAEVVEVVRTAQSQDLRVAATPSLSQEDQGCVRRVWRASPDIVRSASWFRFDAQPTRNHLVGASLRPARRGMSRALFHWRFRERIGLCADRFMGSHTEYYREMPLGNGRSGYSRFDSCVADAVRSSSIPCSSPEPSSSTLLSLCVRAGNQ